MGYCTTYVLPTAPCARQGRGRNPTCAPLAACGNWQPKLSASVNSSFAIPENFLEICPCICTQASSTHPSPALRWSARDSATRARTLACEERAHPRMCSCASGTWPLCMMLKVQGSQHGDTHSNKWFPAPTDSVATTQRAATWRRRGDRFRARGDAAADARDVATKCWRLLDAALPRGTWFRGQR